MGEAPIPGPQRLGSKDAGGSTAGAAGMAHASVPKVNSVDAPAAASAGAAAAAVGASFTGPPARATRCTSSGIQSWSSSRARPERISQKSMAPLP